MFFPRYGEIIEVVQIQIMVLTINNLMCYGVAIEWHILGSKVLSLNRILCKLVYGDMIFPNYLIKIIIVTRGGKTNSPS